MKKFLLFFPFVFIYSISLGQMQDETALKYILSKTNVERLTQMGERFSTKFEENLKRAQAIAKASNMPLRYSTENAEFELVGIDDLGQLVYYKTFNLDAAVSTSTDLVWASNANGYGLTGGGLTMGEWDGGAVRGTHQEFGTRVTQTDGATGLSNHATHVAGTLIAAGVNANAKGMAYAADLSAHDWNSDDAEMTTFAASGGLVSNHSYGSVTGWSFNSGVWEWWGDTTVSATEDADFGRYSSAARNWDSIAWNAPFYLIVKSAGNDRNDSLPAGNTSHEVMTWGGSGWVGNPSTTYRPPDGGVDGYDGIGQDGISKNILTVGAVNDIPGGYSSPNDVVMSSFSNWGPTDDGRIKPDIVGNGIGLTSSSSSGDANYASLSGTSMSGPNVAGSLLLLQEMHHDSNGVYMLSSTLKGLALHTADEAGAADGPDYEHGWGMLNTKSAADAIADTVANRIIEDSLANSNTYTYQVYSDGTTPLAATICWNDPPGTPKFGLNDTTPNLINDLDLRILDAGSTTFDPWVLNPSNPSAAATTGDNFRDNVEKVYIATPSMGFYTIQVTHKGTLHNSMAQEFSLIVTGLSTSSVIPPIAEFSASDSTICVGDSVAFTDLSQNTPDTWLWNFSGANPDTSIFQNPVVVFDSAGSYTIELTATNSAGTDTETKMMFIQVNPNPQVSFSSVTASGQDTFCIDEPDFDITTAAPFGGLFSGTPIPQDSTFSASIAGAGTHDVIYTVDSAGCSASDTVSVEVLPLPTVTHTPGSILCDATPAFTLTGGTPAGGVYSGPGIVNDTIFDAGLAGVGIHNITYTFTNNLGCSNSTAVSYEVTQSPSVNAGTYSSLCANAQPFALTGLPAGGTFTEPGVQGSSFNPVLSGSGSFTITYTVTSNNCTVSDDVQIAVDSLPNVNFGALNDVCLNSNPVQLNTGTPAGGSYFGNGVSMGLFDPSTVGIGAEQLGYSFTNTNGCTDTAFTTLNVINAITVSTNPVSGICEADSAFVLSMGSPSGGVYSGPGMVNDTVFDPALSGGGTFDIIYTYDLNGCLDADTNSVSVDSMPMINFPSLGTVCIDQQPIALNTASPSGGVYSGPFVTNNIFDPQTAGLGNYAITYSITNGSCTATETANIEVSEGLAEITNMVDEFCENDAPLALQPNPINGMFSGPGLTANLFIPGDAGVGTHTISYMSLGACADTADYVVTVHPNPVINTVGGPQTAVNGLAYTYSVTPNNGSSYQWVVSGGDSNYTTNNAINITWGNGPGGTLSVIETNQFGCSDSASINIDLNPADVAELSSVGSIQLFPNPAKDNVTVLAEDQLMQINVLGVNGQTLQRLEGLNAPSTQMDISNLSQGIYWVQVVTQRGQAVLKLVKQ